MSTNTTHEITPSPRPSTLAIWVMASRPKTLGAAFAPVLMGAAMAYAAGGLHWPSALCALLGSILIQIGTNFANDYFDFKKGTDTAERVGPTRVTQAGYVSPQTMKWATILVFALVWLPGAYILYRGGFPLLIVGILSIALGVLYTGGPYPLGYLGLGDIFVLIFFGPVAVGGTYYIQTHTLPMDVLMGGLAPGFISVGLLTINNLRDIDGDRRAGKKSLAVRFGAEFARFEYVASMTIACFVIPVYFSFATPNQLWAVFAILAMLAAKKPIMIVLKEKDPRALNAALARTGIGLPLYALGFTICAVT